MKVLIRLFLAFSRVTATHTAAMLCLAWLPLLATGEKRGHFFILNPTKRRRLNEPTNEIIVLIQWCNNKNFICRHISSARPPLDSQYKRISF